LWHKIFGPPAGQAEKAAGEESHYERPEEPEQTEFALGEPTMMERVEEAWAPTGDVADEAFVAPQEEGESAAPGAEAGDERKRRARRRRGRGRGREGSERGERREASGRRGRPDVLETPGADDFDDDFDELVGLDADQDEAGLELAADEDGDLPGGEEGETSGAGGTRVRSAGHRSIPTWDEAIGMIVETNMQTRSQRRPARDSGQRGRSRGGRRRRRPS
jgi:ribonuclease E